MAKLRRGKRKPPKTKMSPLVDAHCSECLLDATIERSHVGRKHKVCGGTRQRRWKVVHGYICVDRKGKPYRPRRLQQQGDRKDHGIWIEGRSRPRKAEGEAA